MNSTILQVLLLCYYSVIISAIRKQDIMIEQGDEYSEDLFADVDSTSYELKEKPCVSIVCSHHCDKVLHRGTYGDCKDGRNCRCYDIDWTGCPASDRLLRAFKCSTEADCAAFCSKIRRANGNGFCRDIKDGKGDCYCQIYDQDCDDNKINQFEFPFKLTRYWYLFEDEREDS